MTRSEKIKEFEKEIEFLLNKCGIDNELKTPDYILASYLCRCLNAYDELLSDLDKHYTLKENQ